METHCLGTLMFLIFIGHAWGDYLTQSNWMALNKSKEWWICAIHCFVYSACVCLFLWNFTPFLFILIFLTHYPIDRYSLGQRWLDVIGSRNFMAEQNSDAEGKETRVSFSTLVYCIADNTMHLTLLWIMVVWLQSLGMF